MGEIDHSIAHVVADGLCHRCGACEPACPVPDCITLGGDLYPRVNAATCINCSLCERVCSGDRLALDELLRDRGGPPPHPPGGGYRDAWVIYVTDAVQRMRSASGGFVTQLLVDLVERGEIDGAIVAGMNPQSPWEAIPAVARTPEQIRAGSGSKYATIPMVSIVRQVLHRRDGHARDRYAFVGVSCHLHSLAMLMRRLPSLRRQIVLTIGLYCGASFDPEATVDLIRAAGVELGEVDTFQNRGGQWPGIMRVRKRDGTYVALHPSNVRDGAINYLKSLYTQPRCQLCYDFSNELADLAAGDPWIRDAAGRYRHVGGHTLVLARTERGQRTVESIRADPRYVIEAVDEEYVQGAVERHAAAKRRAVGVALASRRAKGRPVPAYDRDVPAVGGRARLSERLFALTYLLGRNPRLRYLVLKLLVSAPGWPVLNLRLLCKFGWKGSRYIRSLTPPADSGAWAMPLAGDPHHPERQISAETRAWLDRWLAWRQPGPPRPAGAGRGGARSPADS